MKRLFAILLALLLPIAALCGCGQQEETVLRYAVSALPRSLDPQFADPDDEDLQLLLTQLYFGLTRLQPDGKAGPACAERWEVSPDGLTYTFYLRDGLCWADGSPLTAEDFVFGLRRLFDVPHLSPSAGFYRVIRGAEGILDRGSPLSSLGVAARGDDAVAISLEKPGEEILTLLSRPAAAPCSRAFFEDQKGRYGLEKKTLLTNGAFLLQSWGKQGFSLGRNEACFAPAVPDGAELTVAADAAELYLAGDVDFCLVDGAAAAAGGLTGTAVHDRTWSLLLNPARSCFYDEALRRALLAAVDEETLSERAGAYSEKARGLVSPAFSLDGVNYRDAVGPTAAPSLPGDARAAMLEAFSRLGIEKYPKTTLLVCDDPVSGRLGGALLQNWADILSTYVNLESVPYQDLLSRVRAGDFDLALSPLPTDSGDETGGLRLFASLPIGRELPDAKADAKGLFAFEQAVVDAAAAMPVCETPSVFVCRPEISGVWIEPSSRVVHFEDAVKEKPRRPAA